MNEDESRNLIARMLAGEDVRAEIDQLSEKCQENEKVRTTLAEVTMVEGLLALSLEDSERRSEFLRRVDHSVAEIGHDRVRFAEGVLRRLAWQRRWYRGIAVATVGAIIVLFLGAWWLHGDKQLARIQRMETVTWSHGADELSPGAILFAGARLRIQRGLMEVWLQEKGSMMIEGPADLEFVDANRAMLRSGRIVLHVTEHGHGYRVETPQGTLVDLGTQFGVTVSEGGIMETHVLEGKVEAIPKTGGSKLLLEKGSAIRFAGGNPENLKADPDIFYTALPPLRTRPLNYVHWSLNSADGLIVPAVSRGFDDFAPELRLNSLDAGKPPVQVDGPFGGALSFDGLGGFAESGFPGIGGAHPRTVAFWVKVPRDFSLRNGFGVVSWGHFAGQGSVWQVSINPLAEDGAIGRIRVGTHGGWIVGTKDLRDGIWHHVAVVMYGGERPDIGTHVLVYLDGDLEPISKKALREIDTQLAGAQHGVWLGRNISHRDSVPPIAHGGFFQGEIDEVFICDAALAQDEINDLMKKNLLPRN